jgi:hypothetical protein
MPHNMDTKKYVVILNNLPSKGLCGRCLSEFIAWRWSKSRWYFRPSLVNCCSSPLLSGLTLPPPPFPYTVCNWGEGMGFGQISTCHKVPLHFFRRRHFALPSMSLIFLRGITRETDVERGDWNRGSVLRLRVHIPQLCSRRLQRVHHCCCVQARFLGSGTKKLFPSYGIFSAM